MRTISLFFLIFSIFCCVCLHAEESSQTLTPVDSQLDLTTLPNGLKLAVYPNSYPKNVVEFRLIVDVGSLDETENEWGLAHYVEHMAFNGSKHFPGQSMVKELEERGVRFGQHNNASTSHYKTIYSISIPNEGDNIDFVLQILRDVADGLLIKQENFEEERGVILEEVRVRTLGVNARLSSKQTHYHHPNSPLTKHPVGSKRSVSALSVKQANDFYKKWYQANNMTLIIAGDVTDFSPVKASVVNMFGSLRFNHELVAKAHQYFPNTSNLMTYTDEEPLTERVILSTPFTGFNGKVIDELKSGWQFGVITRLINERFERVVEDNPSVLLSASINSDTRLDKSNYLILSATATDKNMPKAIGLLKDTYIQATKYGISENELSTYITKGKNRADSYLKLENKIQSKSKSSDIIGYLTRRSEFMSVKQWCEQYTLFLDNLNKERINEYIETLPQTGFSIEYVTNEDENTAQQLMQKNSISKRDDIKPWHDDISLDDIFKAPITLTKQFKFDNNNPFKADIIQLKNGVTIYFKEHVLSPGQVSIKGVKSGGLEQVGKSDYLNVAQMLTVKWSSKIGNATGVNVKRFFREQDVNLSQYTNSKTFRVTASGKAEKVDVMLNGIDWLFKNANFEQKHLDSRKIKIKQSVEKKQQSPTARFNQAYTNLIFQNHWRKQSVTEAELDTLSTNAMKRLYSEKYQNAAGFHFFVTGDFSKVPNFKQKVASVFERLPTTGSNERIVETKMPHVKGLHSLVHNTLNEDKAHLLFRFYSEQYYADNMTDWETNRVLKEWVKNKLQDRVREDMSASYGVNINSSEDDTMHYLTNSISTTIDPANIVVVKKAIMNELDLLKQSGISADTLKSIKARRYRDIKESRQKSSYWNTALIRHYLWGYPIEQVLEPEKMLSKMTVEEINRGINKWFNGKDLVTGMLLPKNAEVIEQPLVAE